MNSSEKLEISNSNPLMLHDTAVFYEIKTGVVDLFMVDIQENGAAGKRKHILRLYKGDAFWGIDAFLVWGKAVLAVGGLNTMVIRYDWNADTKEALGIKKLSVCMERWISAIHEHLGDFYYIKGCENITPADNTIESERERVINIHNGFYWVVYETGTVQAFDDYVIDETPFPVTKNVPLKMGPASKIALFSTLEVLKKFDCVLMLSRFHETAFSLILNRSSLDDITAKKVFGEQKAADELLFRRTLSDFAESLSDHHMKLTVEHAANTAMAVCSLVTRARHIDIDPSLGGETITEIIKKNYIRSRKIVLTDEWWKKDCGSFIAYLEDGNLPVAVVQDAHGSYLIIDVQDSKKIVVTRKTARLLSGFGLVLYTPLPHKKVSVRDLFSFGMKGMQSDFLIILFMGILSGVFSVGIPIISGIIFDVIIPGAERFQLFQIGLVLLMIIVAQYGFVVVQSISILRFSEKMGARLQAAVWDRLLTLPVPFFNKFTAGDLAERAMGINSIQQILTGSVMTTMMTAVFTVFNFALMFYYNASLAAGATILILAVAAVTTGFGVLKLKYQRILTELQGRLSGTVLQFMAGIPKFRIAGIENRAYVMWARDFLKQRDSIKKTQDIENINTVFSEVFNIFATILIFVIIVITNQKNLSTGSFIAFNTAFTILLTTITRLSSEIMNVLDVIPLYERSKPILETLGEVDEYRKSPGNLVGDIDVKHVSFRYSEDTPLILQDVSVEIKQGEFAAFVGPSGSGKSTLLRILLGFEKPEAGAIYFDDQDLEDLDIREVRSQMGVVLQHSKLQDGSLLDNIIGSHPLGIDDAWEATKMAGVYDDIKQMPMELHTILTGGGSSLSGGQRQRLLIARAVANRPKILFFDEATSALDNKTQATVSRSLEGLQATRIVIAHRLSTIINADKIFVLKDGKIIEQGTYTELLEQNGFFTDLANRQLT